MEERLNYLIDLLIEKDKVIDQLRKYYAETAEEYDNLKKATNGETVKELKEEIHKLDFQLNRLETQYESLEKENAALKSEKCEQESDNNPSYYTFDSPQEQSDCHFESYNAAKEFLVETYGDEALKLRTERDVEAFFIRHGKKLIIRSND